MSTPEKADFGLAPYLVNPREPNYRKLFWLIVQNRLNVQPRTNDDGITMWTVSRESAPTNKFVISEDLGVAVGMFERDIL